LIFNSLAGGIRCIKNLTLHSASILSISAGDHWLGIGAADNSMSLFHRPQERFGGLSNAGSKVAGWQLYRTPQKTAAVVCISILANIVCIINQRNILLDGVVILLDEDVMCQPIRGYGLVDHSNRPVIVARIL
jgi:hypothetical protein